MGFKPWTSGTFGVLFHGYSPDLSVLHGYYTIFLRQGKAEPAKDEKKKDATQNLKSNLLISGVVIAVIGAVFAIVKKLKEA